MIDTEEERVKVTHMWHAAAAHHTAGYMSKAVAGWADAMNYQRQKALEAGFSIKKRYFPDVGWTVALGHLAALEIFAKMKILGMTDNEHIIVTDDDHVMLPYMQGIVNKTYFDLLRPFFTVVPKTGFMEDIRLHTDYLAVIEVNGKWEWFIDANCIVEERWQAEGRPPLFKLSDEQIEEGRQKLGLGPDDWFVTVHTRKLNDFQNLRDIDSDTYEPALRRIQQAGGKVFHVPSGDNFIDIFLLAQSKFVVVGNSGPAWAAGTFGTPALLANWVPVGIKFPYKNYLILPKRLFNKKDNRYLSDDEMYNEPFNHIVAETVLAEHGVVALPNTPEEILAGVEHMLRRENLI